MKDKFKVVIVSFSDGRKRVHNSLESRIRENGEILKEALAKDSKLDPIIFENIVYSNSLAKEAGWQIRSMNADCIVFNIPVFAFPNYSLITARIIEQPVIINTPKDGSLPGAGGVLAAAGSMEQVGMRVVKLWGNPVTDEVLGDKLRSYCLAAGAVQRLKGSVYGLFGGRSIGMSTGVASAEQWMKKFGVDIEHIDQLEIIRRAESIAASDIEKGYSWLQNNLGSMANTGKAAPEHIKTQISHYLATKDIIKDLGLDFIGIKCHFDLSEYYVTQCLSAMLLNDPYDWNGPKEPCMMACEADSDGAMTMHILKLISGYPSLLFDVRSYDQQNEKYVFCNCGSQPSWYAARSNDPLVNLAKVNLSPVIPKYAGNGGHYNYICKEGPFTLARLSRANGEYRMFITRGEFAAPPEEKNDSVIAAWPRGYADLDIKPDDFFQQFSSNHAHIIPGDHVKTLQIFCKLTDIKCEIKESV